MSEGSGKHEGTGARRHEGAPAPLPTATVRPERRHSVVWIVPVLALLFAAWLVVSAWRQRGVTITVQLPDGHGIKVGDPVRYRGISIGEVSDVELIDEHDEVLVTARLWTATNAIARAGTRFWVVRPQLRVSGVEGIETLLGPRYLAVVPAATGGTPAAPRRDFVGLAAPPAVASAAPDDLEFIVEASRRGSLAVGAPVRYRQMRVGTVLSVGLSSDASIVEARVHVPKAYRGLVRNGTRFWDAGGMRAEIGLSGWSLEVDSFEGFLTGGIALATPAPEEAGDAVRTGHRFTLHAEAEDEWLEWEPNVPIGNSLLPPGSWLPQPLRATVAWKAGFLIKGQRSRGGWVLAVEGGLLGPADLLTPTPAAGEAERGTVSLEVAGQLVPLAEAPLPVGDGLARLAADVDAASWPPDRLRRPDDEPEDCIAIADPSAPPFPLAASRLHAEAGRWIVDPAISLDETWHGACVVSRRDGKLVGLLLIEEETMSIAPVTLGDDR